MSITVPQKKRGRPATGEAVRVACRMDGDLLEAVRRVAQKRNVTLSDAIRGLVEAGLRLEDPEVAQALDSTLFQRQIQR